MENLKRKPGAFARWVLRDEVFPRQAYRQTWERLRIELAEREACKTIVGLLILAADGYEAELALELERLHARNEIPNLGALQEKFAPRATIAPSVEVRLPNPATYDILIAAAS